MADKKNLSERPTDSIAERDQEELQRSPKELLGARKLKKPETKYLLRFQKGILPTKLVEQLKIKTPQLEKGHDKPTVPIVLGPFPRSQIEKFYEEALIEVTDQILKSFDRWKPLRAVFPDLAGDFAGVKEEVTATATAGANFDETQTQTPANQEEGYLTVAEDEKILNVEELKLEETPEETPKFEQTRAVVQPSAANKANSPRPALGVNTVQIKSRPQSKNIIFVGLIVALVGAVAYIWHEQRVHQKTENDHAPIALNASSPLDLKVKEYPENLKPLSTDTLLKGDTPLVQKIRPILMAYERGATVLSENDEQLLKALSDPASASWEARKLAANQLAVFYLSSQKTAEAKAVLNPIYEATPTDPITLLNLTLISLVDGDLKRARELGTVGLRLCPTGLQWVAYALLGIIESSDGKIAESEKDYQAALNRSSNNPFIYGMWAQSLFRSEPLGRLKISKVLREALWADPDRLMDSPIPAPFGGQVLLAEALEGFKKGAEASDLKLNSGQSAFLRWLDGRSRFNPLSQPLSAVMELLQQEEEPQSQILYAYGLKEQGRYDDAIKVLEKNSTGLEGRAFSSWPWEFLGSLYLQQGKTDLALHAYQKALVINPQDVSSIVGLALINREKGDNLTATQKFSEALALDPFFVPALLRIDRFEWHKRYRAK